MVSKREELGLTQDDVAKILKVSRTTISAWETGRNEPSLDMIIKLKKLYKTQDDRFFLNGNDTKRAEEDN